MSNCGLLGCDIIQFGRQASCCPELQPEGRNLLEITVVSPERDNLKIDNNYLLNIILFRGNQFLTSEYGTDRLYRNVGEELPLHAL
jgi:hypothetical protein